MRKFNKILFFGGVNADDQVVLLRKRFNDAITLASDIQQPCHCTYENCGCEEQYKKDKAELKDIIADISMALLGENIK